MPGRRTRFIYRLLWVSGMASLCNLLPAGCGVNTDEPVYPLTIFNTAAPPAIVAVEPVEVLTLGETALPEYKIQFDVSYYLTNQEAGFLGYNLYMTSTDSSPDNPTAGPYLPLGYEPTFSHIGESPDTSLDHRITQRVTHFKPPPGESPFEFCEIYYFTMRAYTRHGIESPPAPSVTACAAKNRLQCPTQTACNP